MKRAGKPVFFGVTMIKKIFKSKPKVEYTTEQINHNLELQFWKPLNLKLNRFKVINLLYSAQPSLKFEEQKIMMSKKLEGIAKELTLLQKHVELEKKRLKKIKKKDIIKIIEK